ncbi:MAG: hypothetical protein JWM09_632 [Francisellaceae bacterium]|nr:hypothetical protein [Francisellaceae bacterium]
MDTFNPHLKSSHINAQLAFIILLINWVLLFWPSIEITFKNPNYLLGNLFFIGILGAIVFAIWQKRLLLKQLKPNASPMGLIGVLLLMYSWGYASYYHYNELKILSILLMIPVLIYLCFGFKAVYLLSLPIWLSLLLSPLPEQINQYLIHCDIQVLNLWFPKTFSDSQLYAIFEHGQYWLTVLSLTIFYAYLKYRKLIYRLLFIFGICIAFEMAIILNGIGIINNIPLLGNRIILIIISGIAWIISIKSLPNSPLLIKTIEPDFLSWHTELTRKQWSGITLITLSLMWTTPWILENIELASSLRTTKKNELVAPFPVGGWQSSSIDSEISRPFFHEASSVIYEKYSLNLKDVYLYSAYYQDKNNNYDLLATQNNIYDPQIWNLKERNIKTIFLPNFNNRKQEFIEELINSSTQKRIVWYWYHVSGIEMTNFSMIKILDNLRAISKYGEGAGVIVLMADYEQSPQEARHLLESFVATYYLQLKSLLNPSIRAKNLENNQANLTIKNDAINKEPTIIKLEELF